MVTARELRERERAQSRRRQSVVRAFVPAEQEITRQEEQVKLQIQQARQTLEAQRLDLAERRRAATTAQQLRGADRQQLSQRQRFVRAVGQAQQAIRGQKVRVATVEARVKEQVAVARTSLAVQKREAFKRLAQAEDQETVILPQRITATGALQTIPGPLTAPGVQRFTTTTGVGAPVLQVTTGLIPAQRLPGIRVVDITPAPTRRGVRQFLRETRGQVTDILSASFGGAAILFPTRPTTLTGAELQAEVEFVRQPLREAQRLPLPRSLTGLPPPTTIAGRIAQFGAPAIATVAASFEQRARGFRALQKFRKSVAEAETVGATAQRDVQTIEQSVVPQLTQLETEQDQINIEVKAGNEAGGFTQDQLRQLELRQQQIESKFTNILSDATTSGLKIKREDGKVFFSSTAIETDIGPASTKQLAFIKETGGRPKLVVAAELARELGQAVAIGAAFGATGLGAQVGRAAQFVQPIIRASPFFPLATTAGQVTAVGVLTGGAAIFGGVRGAQAGAPRGVAVPAAILGAGEPLARTAGFVGGAAIGSRLFSQRTIEALEAGKLTKELEVKTSLKLDKTTGKVGTIKRIQAETVIPGTRGKIVQVQNLKILESSRFGKGVGGVKATITGLGPSKTFRTNVVLFRIDKTTGVVTATRIKSGTNVRLVINKLRITTSQPVVDEKTVRRIVGGGVKFNRQFGSLTEQLGQPVIVKPGTPVSVSLKRLFTTDVFADVPIDRSRTIETVLDFPQGQITTGLTTRFDEGLFKSATKSFLKKGIIAAKQTSANLIFVDKKGQILSLPKPTPAPITSKFVPSAPAITPSLGGFVGQLQAISPQIAPAITAQQAQFTATGATLASTLGLGLPTALAQQAPQQLQLLTPLQPQAVITIQPTAFAQAAGQAGGVAQVQAPAQVQITAPAQVQPSAQITPTVAPPVTARPVTFIPPTPLGAPTPAVLGAIQRIRRAAFDVFVKRRGKFKKVGDDLPLGIAIRRGARITKTTLASTFKVVRDKKTTTTQRDVDFRPDPNIFRDFRIVRGQRVPLPRGPDTFEFIEKRGKRLTTGPERREIQFETRLLQGLYHLY